MTEDGFGYITIEDDRIVVHTGSHKNETIRKFENEEIIKALKIVKLLNKRIE